ncbi:hypothetical protein [Proteiniclasticum ruminis]|uniref:Uncharacterized protein n=1 Tax=Proteiniclasticum ruminis TaxID=398199 RepID=A0A1I5BB70_9CLOT|nr:hypothetical protein [Proteiniclasticum ruminis]SFN71946.1 hypothetical protein SAMN04488695_104112 [Proteiniclasticum ruminis]
MSQPNSSINCYKCGDPINSSVKFKIHGNEYCSACFNNETSNSDSNTITSATVASYSTHKNKYSKYLGVIAIIELISSIFLGFYIWVEFNFGLGFAIIFQGIVFFILLSALEIMAEDIAHIRNNQH